MLKLSILIPVYNERATIREILARVRAVPLEIDGDVAIVLRRPGPVVLEKEIIVVDDGSTDGTREILKEEEKVGDLRVFYHERNQGKGAAIRTAIQHATGDILLIQDADLEYDPRDYPILLKPIIEGRAEVVYGSRFLGGPRKAMLFWHMVANKILTLVTNILYDSILSDMETCYKVFRADVIRGIPLRARRFEFEPEVTAKVLKRGYRIYEVPISYTGREYAEGKKIGFKDGIIALWTLLKYRFVD
ncbi:MAG TPA: glycosyltransferase family 2 protein [Caldilineae bacterium]|nr:glycosyltransferase family 2 protein [Caldilineae bacterium]